MGKVSAGYFDFLAKGYFPFGGVLDSVACPVCLQIFKKTQITLLSMEHIVPKAVGGRVQTVTCEKCNKTLGSLVDSSLAGMMDASDIFNGNGLARADLFVGKHRLRVDSEWNPSPDKTNQLIVIKKSTDPKVQELAIESLKKGERDLTVNLRFKGNPKRAKIAQLKSAYLSMFYLKGYEYILKADLESLRTQFKTPSKVNSSLEALIIELSNITNLPIYYDFVVAELGDQLPLESVLVITKIYRKTTRYLGTILPCGATKLPNLIKVIEDLKQKKTTQSLKIIL